MPANGKEPLARSTASTSGSAAVTGVLHRSSRQNQAELTPQRVTCDEVAPWGWPSWTAEWRSVPKARSGDKTLNGGNDEPPYNGGITAYALNATALLQEWGRGIERRSIDYPARPWRAPPSGAASDGRRTRRAHPSGDGPRS